MNKLARLFTGTIKTGTCLVNRRSFLDCVSVMHESRVKAVVDPDYLIATDAKFKATMDAVVTCPYCSNEIVFGDAIKMDGISLTIECPVCHTTPPHRNEVEYYHI